MLRYTLDIGGRKIILNHKQLQALMLAFTEPYSECVTSAWAGQGKGENGGSYTFKLETMKVSDMLGPAISVLPEPEYDALKFIAANAANAQ